jgi:hypothetical protein
MDGIKKTMVTAVVGLLYAACGGASSNNDYWFDAVDGGPGALDGSLADVHVDGAQPPKDGSRPDGPPPVDANPSGDPGIRCGTAVCAPGVQVCCRPSGGGASACTGPNDCGALALPCDDAQDCATAGQPQNVCCANYQVDPITQQTEVTQVSCRSAKVCDPQSSLVVICDPADPKPCPQGTACKASAQTLPGYFLCF